MICSSAIYGGTYNLFHKTMREMGIDFTFVPPDISEDELRAAFRENTKCVFGETISNPSLDIIDIEMFARAAHEHGVPFIIDNTFATPVNCRPIEFGADIVTHSTTKYIDGHACAVGGVVIDSGNFNWDNGKFPALTTPDESYHGVYLHEGFWPRCIYYENADAPDARHRRDGESAKCVLHKSWSGNALSACRTARFQRGKRLRPICRSAKRTAASHG